MRSKRIVFWFVAGILSVGLITCALIVIRHQWFLSAAQSAYSANKEAVPVADITVKDASDQILQMQRWAAEVGTPKDAQIAPQITAAVRQTGQLWQEWQSLLSSSKIKIKPWEGTTLASGSWKSPDRTTDISLIFRKRRISECTRRVYSPNGAVEKFYRLGYFEAAGGIEYCELDRREFLWFYPGNKISRYARKLDPPKEGWETWSEIAWDESGKIISERTRTFEIPEIKMPARPSVRGPS